MSWLGLFLLVWIGCCVVGNKTMDARQFYPTTTFMASLITLACWLLAQGRW